MQYTNLVHRFLSKIDIKSKTECWIWLACKDRLGYGRFRLNGKTEKAYRVSWIVFSGPIHAGMSVCHSCDNPSCVNPWHLFLGTQSENTKDRHEKGRSRGPKGNLHGRRKISKDQADMIRSDPKMQKDIAKKYGITQAQVSKIKLGLSWKKEV